MLSLGLSLHTSYQHLCHRFFSLRTPTEKNYKPEVTSLVYKNRSGHLPERSLSENLQKFKLGGVTFHHPFTVFYHCSQIVLSLSLMLLQRKTNGYMNVHQTPANFCPSLAEIPTNNIATYSSSTQSL